MHQVFEFKTGSKHNDIQDLGSSRERAELVGHRSIDQPWESYYEMASKSRDIHFLKTHEPPPDDSKAIYVIRDGHSSIVSYSHYLNQFTTSGATLFDVMFGAVNFGSWSDHIASWDPKNRPSTLLLRFEDVLADPETAVRAIAEFTGLKPLHKYEQRFDEQKKKFPEFFRSGDNKKNISELSQDEMVMFQALHGATAAEFGYQAQVDNALKKLPATFQAIQKEFLKLKDVVAHNAELVEDMRSYEERLKKSNAALSHQRNIVEVKTKQLAQKDTELLVLNAAADGATPIKDQHDIYDTVTKLLAEKDAQLLASDAAINQAETIINKAETIISGYKEFLDGNILSIALEKKLFLIGMPSIDDALTQWKAANSITPSKPRENGATDTKPEPEKES